jgi:hypothetical protein
MSVANLSDDDEQYAERVRRYRALPVVAAAHAGGPPPAASRLLDTLLALRDVPPPAVIMDDTAAARHIMRSPTFRRTRALLARRAANATPSATTTLVPLVHDWENALGITMASVHFLRSTPLALIVFDWNQETAATLGQLATRGVSVLVVVVTPSVMPAADPQPQRRVFYNSDLFPDEGDAPPNGEDVAWMQRVRDQVTYTYVTCAFADATILSAAV